jgi:hypothetical protein
MIRNYQEERQDLITEISSLRVEISHLEALEKFIQTNSITEYTPNVFKEADDVDDHEEDSSQTYGANAHSECIEKEKIN